MSLHESRVFLVVAVLALSACGSSGGRADTPAEFGPAAADTDGEVRLRILANRPWKAPRSDFEVLLHGPDDRSIVARLRTDRNGELTVPVHAGGTVTLSYIRVTTVLSSNHGYDGQNWREETQVVVLSRLRPGLVEVMHGPYYEEGCQATPAVDLLVRNLPPRSFEQREAGIRPDWMASAFETIEDSQNSIIFGYRDECGGHLDRNGQLTLLVRERLEYHESQSRDDAAGDWNYALFAGEAVTARQTISRSVERSVQVPASSIGTRRANAAWSYMYANGEAMALGSRRGSHLETPATWPRGFSLVFAAGDYAQDFNDNINADTRREFLERPQSWSYALPEFFLGRLALEPTSPGVLWQTQGGFPDLVKFDVYYFDHRQDIYAGEEEAVSWTIHAQASETSVPIPDLPEEHAHKYDVDRYPQDTSVVGTLYDFPDVSSYPTALTHLLGPEERARRSVDTVYRQFETE